jgi:RNA exonuclease 1
MPANKKYKLYSTTNAEEEGKPLPCAFFNSEKGCRNGDSCKFAHVPYSAVNGIPSNPKTPTSSAIIDSVVSSESSDGECSDQKQTVSSLSSPFVSLTAKKAATETEMQTTAGKKKRDENPFANPKQQQQHQQPQQQKKKQKTTNSQNKNPPPNPSTEASVAKPKAAPYKKGTLSRGSDFRGLDLPIASFSLDGNKPQALTQTTDVKPKTKSASVKKEQTQMETDEQIEKLPLPTSTAVGQKWIKVVQKTREHPRYETNFDTTRYKELDEQAGYASNTWVKTVPFDASKHKDNPQAIAIDCEMCETQDPVSGNKDPRALCRFSVVDTETNEVLIDTLVKPMWPVTDYRTWVNGIGPEHLQKVEFTLRHAQAFMMALCSEETVILGHAVHNDLAALRMEHHCVADSSCLFSADDSETATVSLRDLSSHVLKNNMPDKHDSVNDARVAFQCLEKYRLADGNMEKIPRTSRNRTDYNCQLFVHRIPKGMVDESQLANMFLAHTDIQPTEVDEIDFSGNSGKTHVHFRTGKHGNLAFESLEGKAEADLSGRLQKKVFLRNGNYVRVRKMAYESKKDDPEGDRKRRMSS